MDQEFDAVWQKLTYVMMRMLDGRDLNLVACLYSKHLLSDAERETVTSKTITSEANHILLEALKRRGRTGMDGLLECLKEDNANNALVKEIEKVWPPKSSPQPPLSDRTSQESKHLLNPEDVDKLFEFTKNAAPFWRNIGTALGFRKAELDAITTKSALNTNEDYFQELLDQWLNWAPPEHSLPYTENLAIALQRNRGRLAIELKKESSPFMSLNRI